MALKLIPPGQRKGNPFYLVRGSIGGRRYEFSTETRDETAAGILKAKFELDILQGGVPGPGAEVTFARAAELYKALKQPSKTDITRIDRLVAHIGLEKLVHEVGQADLVDAGNALYEGRKNETKNRSVIKPGAAILHYAARAKWCPWLRIEKFKEAPVVTRAANDAVADVLLTALQRAVDEAIEYRRRADNLTPRDRRVRDRKVAMAERKHLVVLWLFRHWNRISDPLRLKWEKIDLQVGLYEMLISKGSKIRTKPLDDDVIVALANLSGPHSGYIFPWRTRSGVYKWLRPLTRRLGVEFTPHMARHYGGKQLNRVGAGIKTVMGALDHSDPASSARYMDADTDIIRGAMRRTRQPTGETLGESAGGKESHDKKSIA